MTGSDLMALQEFTAPERLRSKNLEGISSATQAIESLERRHGERQCLTLSEKVRIMVLLKFVPPELIEEVCRSTTKRSDYQQ